MVARGRRRGRLRVNTKETKEERRMGIEKQRRVELIGFQRPRRRNKNMIKR